MRKIILGFTFLMLWGENAFANKAILGNTHVPVEKWVVETINYYNQDAGYKLGWSTDSYSEAEEWSISQCENDKTFNKGKPEGCIVYKMTEIYKQHWTYFGTIPPTERTPGPVRIQIYKDSLDRKIKEAENKKINELEVKKKLEVVKKTKEEETKKQLVSSLEKKYESYCTGGLFRKKLTKGTKEYEDCLITKNKEYEAKQEQIAIKLENIKKTEEEKLRSQQKEIENKKQAEAEKLASMTADDRRDYICQNKFGFKKNSTKFQDCRFKLFAGEMELEKLQMQKELAQAKLETAKASEAAARATAQLAQSTQARQEALAQAQIQASQMQAAAAAAQAYAIQQQSATDLITSGLSMMSPRSNPSVNLRTTCTYHGRMLSCF